MTNSDNSNSNFNGALKNKKYRDSGYWGMRIIVFESKKGGPISVNSKSGLQLVSSNLPKRILALTIALIFA